MNLKGEGAQQLGLFGGVETIMFGHSITPVKTAAYHAPFLPPIKSRFGRPAMIPTLESREQSLYCHSKAQVGAPKAKGKPMQIDGAVTIRHFTSYTGIALPPRLVGALDDDDMDNRNSFLRAYFDADDRLLAFEKWVYGEVNLTHRYGYHANGKIKWAEIGTPNHDLSQIWFDEDGKRLAVASEPVPR